MKLAPGLGVGKKESKKHKSSTSLNALYPNRKASLFPKNFRNHFKGVFKNKLSSQTKSLLGFKITKKLIKHTGCSSV